MATDNNKSVEKKKTQTQTKESVYSIKQLTDEYKAFGASYAIVSVALYMSGKTEFTFSEAKEIIDKFKKEVK